MSELKGCSDHNCIIAKPIGMGTNGGCRCEKEVARVGEIGRVVVRKLRMQDKRIAALEKVAEAAAEWFGPSLQDARFETVAVIKALREAGYSGEGNE